jgi:putative DNA-invertase from lambdoid prophage Rac
MGRAAIYLRVSSKEQTVENQLPQLLQLAESRGYEVAQVYQEQEPAWRAGHQRELARLLADCRDGKFKYDAVLVWALDRLTREGIAKMLEWVNTFKTLGVKVISLNESWTDTTGPMAELLYAVCAWAAEFESRRKSERVKAGLVRAVKSGSKLGRPKGSSDRQPRRKSGYYLRYARGK